MLQSIVVAASVFAASALSIPTPLSALAHVNHVLHEKRDFLPHGWSKHARLDSRSTIPMKIALTQSNMDEFENLLMEVSDPSSPKYGLHYNAKQVAETFAPSQETRDAVLSWLEDAGIDVTKLSTSQSLGWLNFKATIEQAERLLRTEYSMYTHGETGTRQVACEKYHVPEHIAKHVDFITPTIHFDADLVKSPGAITKRSPTSFKAETEIPNIAKGNQKFATYSDVFKELKNCSTVITPNCLRILYGIPELTAPSVQTRPFGIFEKGSQAYLQADLDLFFSNFSNNQVQTSPTLYSIDGGYPQNFSEGFGYNGESDLDLEYAMTLVNPIPVILYQVGDPYASASFDTFLDALDASFCKYEGGDNATEGDPVYPDNTNPNGYQGPLACGGFALTKVISNSYGHNENAHSAFYNARQCHEYGKLGLQGVSILYSSGDYGVAGSGGLCTNTTGGGYTNGSSGAFTPSFPGTCPYITAVGATQVKNSFTAMETRPEKACETVIYSGGGFSNQFNMPAYQKKAVDTYYSYYNPGYSAARYNNSRLARGYPDVAANGANYLEALDGSFSLVYGTSASAPTFSSVIVLLNELRAAAGKPSLGFLNPALYAHPGVFTDIIKGGNRGCGTKGFTAVEGWDPVTGLGTPIYSKMVEKLV